MQTKSPKTQSGGAKNFNPLEALKELGSDVVKNATAETSRMSAGVMDEFFNGYEDDFEDDFEFLGNPKEQAHAKIGQAQESKPATRLFNYSEYHERVIVSQEMKELTDVISKEIKMLKSAGAALMSEVKDVENATLNYHPGEKAGIYDIRFMEILRELLQVVRLKLQESNTWLQALQSKRKKRGSAFAARSKSQGTQYSLSQELSNARSVQ
jgi:hypothetical protein